MTRQSMTVKEFNKFFLEGKLDDTFIQKRSTGIINLYCNNCKSDLQQKPPSQSTIHQNCHSYFWDCFCIYCGANYSRRTALSPFDTLGDEETTKVITRVIE